MQQISVCKKFNPISKLTSRTASVLKLFGLNTRRLRASAVTHQCSITYKPGDIVYITGPSGAGKSVLLNELYNDIDASKIRLSDIDLPGSTSVVDCLGSDLYGSLKLLNRAGLGDVFCAVNCPANLSEGQQYRYRLAMALVGDFEYVFADEFCSSLDRITAAVISHNMRKAASKSGKCFFLASCHDDLLCDLQPDVIVIKRLTGESEVVYKDKSRGRK
jgi:hypothetical protein